MSQVLVNDSSLYAIGDAIRDVKGEDSFLPLIIHSDNVTDAGVASSLNMTENIYSDGYQYHRRIIDFGVEKEYEITLWNYCGAGMQNNATTLLKFFIGQHDDVNSSHNNSQVEGYFAFYTPIQTYSSGMGDITLATPISITITCRYLTLFVQTKSYGYYMSVKNASSTRNPSTAYYLSSMPTIISGFTNKFSGPSGTVPFDTATDTEIITMVNAYYNGDISLFDVQQAWHVGDTRTVTMTADLPLVTNEYITTTSGIPNSNSNIIPPNNKNSSSIPQQTYDIVILDFDHDNLTTSINGKTKALVTLQMKDTFRVAAADIDQYGDLRAATNAWMAGMTYSSTDNGNWATNFWRDQFYYMEHEGKLGIYLPNLYTLLKTVNKLSATSYNNSTIMTTGDKLWFPAEIEVTGGKMTPENAGLNGYPGEGTQYTYYKDPINRSKKPYYMATTSNQYWTRTIQKNSNNKIVFISSNGTATTKASNSTSYGISWAFCF